MNTCKDDLTQRLIEFRDARDWKQFHTPENLAKSIAIEAGELLQCFQWEIDKRYEYRGMKGIREEVADIFIYLLYLCHDLGIDPDVAIHEKIIENEKKYPVEKAKGNAMKYTEFTHRLRSK